MFIATLLKTLAFTPCHIYPPALIYLYPLDILVYCLLHYGLIWVSKICLIDIKSKGDVKNAAIPPARAANLVF